MSINNNTIKQAMDGTIALVVINFISILVLFSITLYIIGQVTKVNMEIEKMKEYDRLNERQLENLARDINRNDEKIQLSIRELSAKHDYDIIRVQE
jgi:hypothetical protein